MVTSTEYAELCEKMAEIIDSAGLAKKQYHNPTDGSYCLLGAARHHLFSTESVALAEVLSRFTAADELLSNALGFPERGYIVRWNDDPKRTKEEVVDFLLERAKHWRNQ